MPLYTTDSLEVFLTGTDGADNELLTSTGVDGTVSSEDNLTFNGSTLAVTGNLTLTSSVTIGGHAFDDIDIGSEFVDADDHIMSSGAIKEKIEGYGYTTAAGDITGVTAGTGLSGGGSSGSVTLNVDAAQTQITSVGTIGTGTWQGTAIASAYLDSDTAHLSGTQTFSGAKTFSAAAQFSNTLTVGVDDTGYDVKLFGASAGAYMLWDQSEDQLTIMGASADATTSTGKLRLATSLTNINANDVIGKIDFQAPLEAGGTDAITIAASIAAVAQGTFAADLNATDLLFYTGHSEAATEKLRITSQGEIGIGGANYGTDGQVLTSAGAGVAPAWEDAGGGGASDLDGLADAKVFDSSDGASDLRYNVFIANGANSGSACVTGTLAGSHRANTAMGGAALDALTEGSYNNAMGTYSLSALTTALGNIGIGYYAGNAITGTHGNVFIGYAAGMTATSGTCVAIGYDAMRAGGSSGDDSVAIGRNAGYDLAAGHSNTMIGSHSGENISSGDYNVTLGRRAGDALTTGDKNTMLGADTDGVAGSNFQIGVGYGMITTQASSLALGESGKMLLHGEFSGAGATKLGINLGNTWTAPTANLHVKGSGNTHTTTAILIQDSDGVQIMKLTNDADNIAIGLNALDSVTQGTGIHNICIGSGAGTAVTTEDYNVMIGYAAGGTIAAQSGRHIFIGALAGYACICDTDSYGVVGIGYNALGGLTTGEGNMGIGYSAGSQVADHHYNTFIGWQCGRQIADDGNTAYGYQALEGGTGSTTAAYNTSIGKDTLTVITTGDGNVALGYEAGNTITTGSNNVYIGHLADASAVDVADEIVLKAGVDALAGAGTETIRIGVDSDYITNDFGENNTWTHSSDRRIKKDIRDSELGLGFINDLRPVTYKKKAPSEYPKEFDQYNADKTERKNPNKTHYGFIAQEVKESMDTAGHPNFPVWKENKDGMQELGETELIVPLIKAVQELTAKIVELEAKLENK
tara:strand:- start:15622 stop:18561 length:2940 start_codon:yes stop_codon:yes gene_type:complete